MRFPTDNTAAIAILLAILAWWIWWLTPTTTGSTPDPAPLTTVTGTTTNEEYQP